MGFVVAEGVEIAVRFGLGCGATGIGMGMPAWRWRKADNNAKVLSNGDAQQERAVCCMVGIKVGATLSGWPIRRFSPISGVRLVWCSDSAT